MNYKEYIEEIKNIRPVDTLQFKLAVIWLHPEILPVGLVSVGDSELEKIRVPAYYQNKFGRVVPVIAISPSAFMNNRKVTDVVLPSSIGGLPAKAFSGCTNLKNITIPRKIKTIKEGTFAGCVNLENVYYEGTSEEWKEINIVHEKYEVEFGPMIAGTPVQKITAERNIHIPGNDALLTANIHFRCSFENTSQSVFCLNADGKDITDLFRNSAFD